VTIEEFEHPAQREELLQIIAEDLPVFVLGPGCFRIGFDNPADTNWQRVENGVADVLSRLNEREQRFLKEFFFSKLSDERRTEEQRRQFEERLDAGVTRARAESVDVVKSFEPWRSLLACRILQAYRHASCCLGLMIGQGLYPVLHWQEAAVPADAIELWHRRFDANAPDFGAQEHFLKSRTAIESASRVAGAMIAFERGVQPTKDQLSALDDLPFPVDRVLTAPGALAEVLREPLEILLPKSIANQLDVLAEHCFSPAKPKPLRGGHVEWLGDLLWHVLTGDIAVQPSQADIAFYVSLADSSAPPHSRELKRSMFGDRRATVGDVTRLTTHSQKANGSAARDREEFLGTIARSLVAQHAMVRGRDTSTDRRVRKSDAVMPHTLDKLVLALVDDYGDLFERALFDLLDDDGFHVCLPLWVTSKGKPSIDWVILDVTRNAGAACGSWRWLADARAAKGPIVIKMGGCDRGPLGIPLLHGRVSEIDFKEPGPRYNPIHGASVEPAVLYDEFDRLTAMEVFGELLNPEKNFGLAGSMSTPGKGLTWPDRSWVIMGQRFSDWVPRLRLFAQMWAGSKVEAETASRYWAIDRSFEFPERALLQSLGIKMVAGDLRRVGGALTPRAFREMRRTAIGALFVSRFAEQQSRG
jgi:hypothetical protein